VKNIRSRRPSKITARMRAQALKMVFDVLRVEHEAHPIKWEIQKYRRLLALVKKRKKA